MITQVLSGLIAACVIGTASAACGADTAVKSRDKHFLRQFSTISLEVQRIAELAQTNSQDAEVKELGQKLVQAYTQAGQQVAASAQTAGVQETPRIRRSAARKAKKLANLSGVAFNRAALRELFKCVESGVHQLDLETRNSENAALRQTAALLEADMEPVVWRTAELSAQFNGQP
jgi:predicted outer membrane protein